jgi:hypothetical protein
MCKSHSTQEIGGARALEQLVHGARAAASSVGDDVAPAPRNAISAATSAQSNRCSRRPSTQMLPRCRAPWPSPHSGEVDALRKEFGVFAQEVVDKCAYAVQPFGGQNVTGESSCLAEVLVPVQPNRGQSAKLVDAGAGCGSGVEADKPAGDCSISVTLTAPHSRSPATCRPPVAACVPRARLDCPGPRRGTHRRDPPPEPRRETHQD